jgi:hypothetical protein
MNVCSPERSVLIPYEDLRAARASLPEFSGTKAEDPVRFIENAESILGQANIHSAGWTRMVEPQLKGIAGDWWTSIKILDLSWEEFRMEFLENFDNMRSGVITTTSSQVTWGGKRRTGKSRTVFTVKV